MLKIILIALSISSWSYAARFIIQNPTQTQKLKSLSGVRKVKEFSFANNKFTVVESKRDLSLQQLSHMKNSLKAEKIFEDMEIKLIEPVASSENTSGNAWHVDALKYSQLPTDAQGDGIVVAVLDTGVDYNHDALKSQMWINEKEIAGNGIDDDQNGYVDDVRGYNFAGARDNDPMDSASHGTHCAGLVGALKDPNGNAQGVAPKVKLMAVKVISSSSSFLSDAAEAIAYAVDNGANIITSSWRIYKSWGSYYNEEGKALLKEAIQYAEKNNVIFVAAAGNESKDNDSILEDGSNDQILPAGYKGLSNLIIVASADEDGTPSYFTNYGVQSVTVAAPGGNILSTVPGNQWSSMSGTSMATPIVAGSLARALSAGMTPAEAIEKIKKSTDITTDWSVKVLTGHINLTELLK